MSDNRSNSDIMKRCEGRWKDILLQLGIDRRFLTGRHGPCPLCGGRDRFRWDNKQNRGTYFCNSCGAGDGAKLLMGVKNIDFKALLPLLEGVVGSAKYEPASRQRGSDVQLREITALWDHAKPVIKGDPVDKFLSGRAIDLPRWPANIRYLQSADHPSSNQGHPAMLARVDDGKGDLTQLHTTYLTQDGGKADLDPVRRLHWGGFGENAAVRMGQPTRDGDLGIAEGIETAIAAALIHKVPVWAALSTGLMMKWRPPEGVKSVFIFGDNDLSYGGQSAAYALAHKLSTERPDNRTPPRVFVMIPPNAGTDWNDVLISQAKEEARLEQLEAKTVGGDIEP